MTSDPAPLDFPARGSEVETLPTTPTTPIMVFEGSVVAKHEGRIPAINIDMVEGYQRGTHLVLQVELRVRGVRMEEDKSGELVRTHLFALEEIVMVSSVTPQQAAAAARVGGSASQEAQEDETPVEAVENTEADVDVEQWLNGA